MVQILKKGQSYKINVTDLREKFKMMNAALPLKLYGIWSEEEFEKYCKSIMVSPNRGEL